MFTLAENGLCSRKDFTRTMAFFRTKLDLSSRRSTATSKTLCCHVKGTEFSVFKRIQTWTTLDRTWAEISCIWDSKSSKNSFLISFNSSERSSEVSSDIMISPIRLRIQFLSVYESSDSISSAIVQTCGIIKWALRFPSSVINIEKCFAAKLSEPSRLKWSNIVLTNTDRIVVIPNSLCNSIKPLAIGATDISEFSNNWSMRTGNTKAWLNRLIAVPSIWKATQPTFLIFTVGCSNVR